MRRNLEDELKQNVALCQRIAESEVFAQHVYAALCNQRFFPLDAPQTDENEWTCSWRQAGGIIADIRNAYYHEPQNTGILEDYLHWYCSGMGFLDGAVDEGVVTGDVRTAMYEMGWDIIAFPSDWGV